MNFYHIIHRFQNDNTIDTLGASKLIIVESPAKAHSLSIFLGHHFFVFPSFGLFFHISHLKHIDSSFHILFQFSFLKPFLHYLFSLFSPNHIFFATDHDREGEIISYIFFLIISIKKIYTFFIDSIISLHD